MVIGVLGLQGDVREHLASLRCAGMEGRVVRTPADLAELSGLILPGGESTAISLLGEGGIFAALRGCVRDGFPLFGTCAGMVLLAAEVEGRDEPHLGAIDITVARNASGRQVDSFETELDVDGVGKKLCAVFIRAPFITRVGPGVRVLAEHEGVPVMAEQGNVLVASFHPELTEDPRIHRYFGAIAERHEQEVRRS
ncbi:MAG: pyridoxal 5'-phosphate synthase glutaminase subunit PdxT [Candidatus Bipolaricaulota bacterium]|nr:MAG: pyridoxal 5'-phosphate synthase glutaminase subunit PdxT [Candidatus Bipolaricaulota bacterium]